MKELDSNHLLTLGEEGFYSLYTDGISANPGEPGKPPLRRCLTGQEAECFMLFALLSGSSKAWCMPYVSQPAVSELQCHRHQLCVRQQNATEIRTDNFPAFNITENNLRAGGNWAAEEGQDFIADHKSIHIDFATMHCWPDNWKVSLHDWP